MFANETALKSTSSESTPDEIKFKADSIAIFVGLFGRCVHEQERLGQQMKNVHIRIYCEKNLQQCLFQSLLYAGVNVAYIKY
jgi:hypothetical protein